MIRVARIARSFAAIAALVVGTATAADAQLVRTDMFAPGDGLLVVDQATGMQWLTPVYTRNHAYDDPFVQGIRAEHGFRYATAQEVSSMFEMHFAGVPEDIPGTPEAFPIVSQFFALFGIADAMRCHLTEAIVVECPRTQGLTSETTDAIGVHYAYGMIQFGTHGYAIVQNGWMDTSKDRQLGSWLVRTDAPVVVTPEPSTYLLLAVGLCAICVIRSRRTTHWE